MADHDAHLCCASPFIPSKMITSVPPFHSPAASRTVGIPDKTSTSIDGKPNLGGASIYVVATPFERL